MIKLSKAVIVEGKYDKIRLENILDATISTTNGFGVFKDKEKRELIKLLAKNPIYVYNIFGRIYAFRQGG